MSKDFGRSRTVGAWTRSRPAWRRRGAWPRSRRRRRCGRSASGAEDARGAAATAGAGRAAALDHRRDSGSAAMTVAGRARGLRAPAADRGAGPARGCAAAGRRVAPATSAPGAARSRRTSACRAAGRAGRRCGPRCPRGARSRAATACVTVVGDVDAVPLQAGAFDVVTAVAPVRADRCGLAAPDRRATPRAAPARSTEDPTDSMSIRRVVDGRGPCAPTGGHGCSPSSAATRTR